MKPILVSALFFSILIGCVQQETSNASDSEKEESSIDITGLSISSIDSLHIRNTVKNFDASLTDYIKSKPNRPDDERKVIYILPFGNMRPEVKEIIVDEIAYLEAFFQMEVKMMNTISYGVIQNNTNIKTRLINVTDFNRFSDVKGGNISNLREQIQAKSMMQDFLIKYKPKDAVMILGITEHDIYNPNYNFLYGSSMLKQGIGVASTFRLIDYGNRTKHNIRKVMSKQLANMFSIKNVKDYECILNYHNNKNELENGEFKMSPRALEKLKYAVGFEYEKRFKDLLELWETEGNSSMITYYKRCLNFTTDADLPIDVNGG